jgi:hypothetical protein
MKISKKGVTRNVRKKKRKEKKREKKTKKIEYENRNNENK